MMERSQILETMGELKLYGMKAAYDEIIATAVKRQHEPHRIVGDLLSAEISEKQARSIKYQITIEGSHATCRMGPFQAAPGQGHRRFRVRRHPPSTRPWCATSPAATSSPTSATSC